MASALAIEDQLEGEALTSNRQLLNFEVRSKSINWHDFVEPLHVRDDAVLLHRHFTLLSNQREPTDVEHRPEVLVCHDMMGNYGEDRHFRSSNKFDDYRFYHWAAIDYFCYFSHHYVTIPPSSWINAAHRHGVRVLGTFITEGSVGGRLLHEALQSTQMVDRMVDALVKLCLHFKFEGWLMNIECKVEPTATANLIYFVERLRSETANKVDAGCVFWYDSVLETGALRWQNEINMRNVRFVKAADAMLINYMWNERSLENTLAACEQQQVRRQRAFVGIDIFGRGQIAKFQSKQTLARIVNHRLSVGIFAPAWTYETLQQYGYDVRQPMGDAMVNDAFLQRNDKFWASLWDHLATHAYNTLPFYSDMCLGSGRSRYTLGHAAASAVGFFNLALQSLQPSVPLHGCALRHYADAFNGGSCLRIVKYDLSFRLFLTNFQVVQGRGLVCAYAFKLTPRDGEFDCILRVCADDNARDCYVFLGDYFDTLSLQRGRCYVSPLKMSTSSDVLRRPMATNRIPPDLSPAQSNGWRVRYYVLSFDVAVQVKDVGVLYRRTQEAEDTAYLGAFYLNHYDTNAFDFSPQSNYAFIKINEKDLLN